MLLLMEEIKQLKDRSTTLSDEERRKQAEDMILRLSKYMQLEDDEEEDNFEGNDNDE